LALLALEVRIVIVESQGAATVAAKRRPLGAVGATNEALGPANERPEAAKLIDCGAYFHGRGWSLGTSSNYSVVLGHDPLRLLITASGKDKGRLGPDDFVMVDEAGRAVHDAADSASAARPSAETLLHTMLARRPGVGAVLHTHSVWGTLLSDWHRAGGALKISGYEMQKGLAGITTHETTVELPIFDNTQDIPALVAQVEPWLDGDDGSPRHGFLIQRHGMYTWGRDLAEARRHVEILEFLFEVVGRTAARTTPGAVTNHTNPTR
jgi:methylthioribulose-1-phosphate dehydratase